MHKNEDRGDIRHESVVLEVDSHCLYSLSMPFELAKLLQVLIVHLWRPNCLHDVIKSKDCADEEEEKN